MPYNKTPTIKLLCGQVSGIAFLASHCYSRVLFHTCLSFASVTLLSVNKNYVEERKKDGMNQEELVLEKEYKTQHTSPTATTEMVKLRDLPVFSLSMETTSSSSWKGSTI